MTVTYYPILYEPDHNLKVLTQVVGLGVDTSLVLRPSALFSLTIFENYLQNESTPEYGVKYTVFVKR